MSGFSPDSESGVKPVTPPDKCPLCGFRLRPDHRCPPATEGRSTTDALCVCGHTAFCHYTDITAGQVPLEMCDGSFLCGCGRFEAATADASSQTRSQLSTHPPEVLHSPTRSLPKCNTCTRSFDPDGKPLHYCSACYQDMPASGPSVTTDQAEETP